MQDYIKAGKIAAQALEYGKTLIKKDVKVIEILDKIEKFICDNGGKEAFPPQISLNNTAAHFCPDIGDETAIEEDVVKLDVGVHINGHIADNALTVDLTGENGDLVKASREALNNVLPLFVPETPLREIGETIQSTIESFGFNPVRNLGGHGLGLYQVHTFPSIPNISKGSGSLKDGMVVACEPFASAGDGIVHEHGIAGVFSVIKKRQVRDPFARKVIGSVHERLPFSAKTVSRTFGKACAQRTLIILQREGIVQGYPPLNDTGLVSQAEHSIIVGDKPLIFTKL